MPGRTLALCGILALAGCGGSGSGDSTPYPGGPSGPFTGAYVDSAGLGGVLTFTIPAALAASPMTSMLAPSATVTGMVQTAGGPVGLSGTFNAPAIELSGSQYGFTGSLQGDGHFEGTAV